MAPMPVQQHTRPGTTCDASKSQRRRPRRRATVGIPAVVPRRRRQMCKKNVAVVPPVHFCLNATQPRQVGVELELPCDWSNESSEASLVVGDEVSTKGQESIITVASSASLWLTAGMDEKNCQAQSHTSALEWLADGCSLNKNYRVQFNLEANTVHEITTPYGEIYGRHPRTFVFDRDFNMIPAAPSGFVSLHARHDESDEEDSEEEVVPYFTKWQ